MPPAAAVPAAAAAPRLARPGCCAYCAAGTRGGWLHSPLQPLHLLLCLLELPLLCLLEHLLLCLLEHLLLCLLEHLLLCLLEHLLLCLLEHLLLCLLELPLRQPHTTAAAAAPPGHPSCW